MIYLVNASVYFFRAWFSVPDSMTGSDGEPVNALYVNVDFTNSNRVSLRFVV